MWLRCSYLNLVLKTNWLGWRKSRTNLNFLPTATVRGLQQWGGLFTSIMQRFSKSSEMALSTKLGWARLDALFFAMNGGGLVINGIL